MTNGATPFPYIFKPILPIEMWEQWSSDRALENK